MRIKVTKDAVCGKIVIPANEYWVSLNPDAAEIRLTAGGKDIALKATKRRSAGKTKTTVVQFYAGGGNLWSLVVQTPKQGEWVVFVDYGKN